MSNSNRVTLAQLDKMTAEEVQAIPQDQLVMLVEDLAEIMAKSKARNDRLNAETSRRYAAKAAELRKEAKKDTGTVNVIDGAFQIKADLPKKVEWDQAELAKSVEVLRGWGEDPADYVTIEVKVSEKKYDAWPPKIRTVFEPARTVKVGTQTFKFSPVKDAA